MAKLSQRLGYFQPVGRRNHANDDMAERQKAFQANADRIASGESAGVRQQQDWIFANAGDHLRDRDRPDQHLEKAEADRQPLAALYNRDGSQRADRHVNNSRAENEEGDDPSRLVGEETHVGLKQQAFW
ncbi:hypothetical protein Enr8_07240 [Blastopirellula retiformator]|uniref:Uncharacterized protein n=1 Tax=Blastopirellula retiformator TaxID=2527970 RepID=A0A5C5VMT1_9BACT|nr:hypothetical protein [Blastopirellula retiformator]TWT39029.1 hypothetical protein Enr8_07240 [Blastopirellula retiformator]